MMEDEYVETKVESLENNRVKVEATIDASDVDRRMNQTYKDFARRYRFPGFRPGKAPRPVIDSALGADAIRATVTEALINEMYPKIIDEGNIFPIGKPVFGNPDSMIEAGKPYIFDFTIEVKPELELSSYDEVEIELPPAETTDEEIELEMQGFLEHYGEYQDEEDAATIAEDNYPEIALKATNAAGESIATIDTEGRIYHIGSGLFPEAFDREILGMKKGDTKKFALEVPEDDASPMTVGYAGATIDLEVKCNVVKKRVLPELTDEWVKDTMGFDSVDDLREGIASSLKSQKDMVIPRMKEGACLIELADRVQGDVPDSMAEEEESRLLQDFFTQLQQQGTSFDTYLQQQGLTSDGFKEDVKKQAIDNVKQELALDAWARHFGMEATPEEISDEFVIAGIENPAQAEKEWREEGRIHLVREGVLRAKAMRDVMDKAKVTEVAFGDRDTDEKEKDEKKPEKASSRKTATKKNSAAKQESSEEPKAEADAEAATAEAATEEEAK